MERAARLIKNQRNTRDILNDSDVVRAIWPAAVGKKIAAHTGRLNLVRTTLVVEVEDAIWQKQLHALSHQILARIHKLTANTAIHDIEFRIAVPRRQPQRADSRDSGDFALDSAVDDEAERIQDPVLKKIYRLSRRKATG